MKYYPAELPRPLQASYSTKHKPNMIRTTMADGYARQRLVNQGAPDQVSVQLLLNEQQYRDMLRWYKADIQSGAVWFIMPLLSVDEDQSIQYRYVRIQNGELNAQLISTSPTLGSIYRVSFTLDASNTVVDDGTWEDHYLPTGAGDDVTVDFTEFTDDNVVDDADDLGDATDELNIIEQ